jgi:D-sedoheptulose 7-phosphate isomerase
LGRANDVFVACSTSGLSPNVLGALKIAKELDLVFVRFTGNWGGLMREFCNYLLDVLSIDTSKVQEGHLVLGHIVCGLVERGLFRSAS